jgi:hypothetical protein
MHNPFPLYSERLLTSLIKSGHKYFVRQTYKRGINPFNENQKGSFLISHYNDLNKANIHFEALEHDKNRFLYDISKPEHLERLKAASVQPTGYMVYAPLLQQEWKPTPQVAEKIRKYIDYKLKWKPGRNDTVRSNLFLQFGELYLTLKFRIHEVKVPLIEIEN